MPAVSDAGPLIHLAQIRHLNLLGEIFGKITILPSVEREVVDEGTRLGHPDAKLVEQALGEGYISLVEPSVATLKRAAKIAEREKISESDAQTLVLARALQQPLLTDEKILSVLAKMYGLQVWNTWTILLEAVRTKLIRREDIQQAIRELGERRHKLSPKRVQEILNAADRIGASYLE